MARPLLSSARRCLLEILEATKYKVPILPVSVAGHEWDLDEVRSFINRLEDELTISNPSALALLKKHTNDDLSELKKAVLAVLDAWVQPPHLQWNPHAGDRAIIASLQVSRLPGNSATDGVHPMSLMCGVALQDLIERMGELTNREVTWRTTNTKLEHHFLLRFFVKLWNCSFGVLYRLIFWRFEREEANTFIVFDNNDSLVHAKVTRALHRIAVQP